MRSSIKFGLIEPATEYEFPIHSTSVGGRKRKNLDKVTLDTREYLRSIRNYSGFKGRNRERVRFAVEHARYFKIKTEVGSSWQWRGPKLVMVQDTYIHISGIFEVRSGIDFELLFA